MELNKVMNFIYDETERIRKELEENEMDDLSKIEIAIGSLEEAILADKPPSHL